MDLFADRNDKLWGTEIDGVKCVPPEEVRKEDYIIVTKDYPREVVEGLINEGYIYVESYEKVAREVFMSVPSKKYCKSILDRKKLF